MLTAKEAREITDKVEEKDLFEQFAESIVQGILVGIKKDANAGYCEYLLDLDGYSKEVRKQIIQILESLGYKVKKKQGLLNFIYYSTNTYVISW